MGLGPHTCIFLFLVSSFATTFRKSVMPVFYFYKYLKVFGILNVISDYDCRPDTGEAAKFVYLTGFVFKNTLLLSCIA